MTPPLPGNGLFGWLGRQVGYVVKAVRTDPTQPQVLYRHDRVQEQPMPDQPNLTLRRTTIDEVLVSNDQPQLKRP